MVAVAVLCSGSWSAAFWKIRKSGSLASESVKVARGDMEHRSASLHLFRGTAPFPMQGQVLHAHVLLTRRIAVFGSCFSSPKAMRAWCAQIMLGPPFVTQSPLTEKCPVTIIFWIQRNELKLHRPSDSASTKLSACLCPALFATGQCTERDDSQYARPCKPI